jgi:hypothetical protein
MSYKIVINQGILTTTHDRLRLGGGNCISHSKSSGFYSFSRGSGTCLRTLITCGNLLISLLFLILNNRLLLSLVLNNSLLLS